MGRSRVHQKRSVRFEVRGWLRLSWHSCGVWAPTNRVRVCGSDGGTGEEVSSCPSQRALGTEERKRLRLWSRLVIASAFPHQTGLAARGIESICANLLNLLPGPDRALVEVENQPIGTTYGKG